MVSPYALSTLFIHSKPILGRTLACSASWVDCRGVGRLLELAFEYLNPWQYSHSSPLGDLLDPKQEHGGTAATVPCCPPMTPSHKGNSNHLTNTCATCELPRFTILVSRTCTGMWYSTTLEGKADLTAPLNPITAFN
jgi:hypothetical protein